MQILDCIVWWVEWQTDLDTHIRRLPPGSVVTFTNLECVSTICATECTKGPPAVVQDALLCTSLWRFLLLLLLNLGCLRLDLAGSSERSVNCRVTVTDPVDRASWLAYLCPCCVLSTNSMTRSGAHKVMYCTVLRPVRNDC